MTEWSDEQVLAATDDSGLSKVEDRRLRKLLHRQQAGSLTVSDRPELARLMEVYQTQLLPKDRALAEAVRRELLPPLQL